MNNKVDEILNIVQERHPMHRRRAIIKRIEILKKKMAECNKAKNPIKCKEKYTRKIATLQSTLDRLRNLRL